MPGDHGKNKLPAGRGGACHRQSNPNLTNTTKCLPRDEGVTMQAMDEENINVPQHPSPEQKNPGSIVTFEATLLEGCLPLTNSSYSIDYADR